MAAGPYDAARLLRVNAPKSEQLFLSLLIGQRCVPRSDVYTSADQGKTWSSVKKDIQAGRASIPLGATAGDLDGQAIGVGIWLDSPDASHPYDVTALLDDAANQVVPQSQVNLKGNGAHEVIWIWITWVVTAQ